MKVANKCVNVRERMEVLKWNKRWSSSYPSPPPPPSPLPPLLAFESSVSLKKTLIARKTCKVSSSFLTWRLYFILCEFLQLFFVHIILTIEKRSL